MQYVTLAMAAGSYLLHAWQAYRGSPPTPAVSPIPMVPSSPTLQPMAQTPGKITIGHGELLHLLLGVGGSLVNQAPNMPAPALPSQIPNQPLQPAPAIAPTPAAVPATGQVDLNALLQGLLNLVQARQQPTAPPAIVPTPAAATH